VYKDKIHGPICAVVHLSNDIIDRENELIKVFMKKLSKY